MQYFRNHCLILVTLVVLVCTRQALAVANCERCGSDFSPLSSTGCSTCRDKVREICVNIGRVYTISENYKLNQDDYGTHGVDEIAVTCSTDEFPNMPPMPPLNNYSDLCNAWSGWKCLDCSGHGSDIMTRLDILNAGFSSYNIVLLDRNDISDLTSFVDWMLAFTDVNLQWVSFSSTKIVNLTSGAFCPDSLSACLTVHQYLGLNGLELTSIEPNTFAGMSIGRCEYDVGQVDLSYSNITSLTTNAFSQGTKSTMSNLSLTHANIGTIEHNAFGSLLLRFDLDLSYVTIGQFVLDESTMGYGLMILGNLYMNNIYLVNDTEMPIRFLNQASVQDLFTLSGLGSATSNSGGTFSVGAKVSQL